MPGRPAGPLLGRALWRRAAHRVGGVIDLLTAAVGEYHPAVILHYDVDFEHNAAVTGQPHAWIAPRAACPDAVDPAGRS